MLWMASEARAEGPGAREGALEGLIEDYLIALGEGARVDRAPYLERLRSDDERRRFLLVVLAEEYLFRQERGERVRLEDALGELEAEGDREAFLQYLEDSRRAGRFRPAPLPAGTLLAGRYRVQGELASGGTAILYRAHDEEFDCVRTIKAFNHAQASVQMASDWEELVRGEARTLARLESRNIVTVHDVVRDGENSYIVMDLVRGRDLAHVLDALRRRAREGEAGARAPVAILDAIGRDAEGEYQELVDERSWYRSVARIVGRAARALELAHEKGVCHRDVKPANILLAGGGEPVLLDFGFGHGPSSAASLEERLIGTPEYMAPEQFRSGRSGDDPRTDVYQLGVVLYEFLTLACPFDREAPGFLERKQEGRFAPPRALDRSLPAALDAITRKAMAGELERRYRSAREMRIDLERFDAGKPPRFAGLGGPARAAMWLRLAACRPVVQVASLALAALVVVYLVRGGGWYPPEITPYRLSPAGVVALGEETLIPWDGSTTEIGLEIEARDASYLYAFLVSGDDRAQRRIRPLRLMRSPDPDRATLQAAPGPWRLDPGRERLACFWLDGDEGEVHRYEELKILACEEELPSVAHLVDAIETSAGDWGDGMRYDVAQVERILRAPTRGVGAERMPAEKLDLLYRGLADGQGAPEEDARRSGVWYYQFRFEIEREEER